MGESEPATPRGRILLIDDDRVFGLWATKVLEANNFYINHVLDPVTGLRQVEAEPWDLVITDVEMPRMSGLEFLERVRRLVPGLPVVVVTAHPTVDRAVTALRHVGTEFIHKPITGPEFVARVTSLMAQYKPARAAVAESVLAIGAHPGDLEIGAAGALLAHQAAGLPVTVLTLSAAAPDGTPWEPGGEPGNGGGIGTRLDAADLTGPDSDPGNLTSTVIEKAIEQVKPTVLYTHSLHDTQLDHRQVYNVAVAAARRVGRVYCYQSPSATIDFRPGHFVDIDEYLAAKLGVTGIYLSQPEVSNYLEPDQVASTARYWARYCQSHPAEAFEVVREPAGTS
jgi:two-component system response regulator HydG